MPLGIELMCVYYCVGLHMLRYILISQAHLSLCYRPTHSQAASLLDSSDFTQLNNYIYDRTPLKSWSVRRRDLYRHSTKKTQDRNVHALEGFEPIISVIKRQQTAALDSTANGNGRVSLDERNYNILFFNFLFPCIIM